MDFYRIRCFYEKGGAARFVSHKNLQKVFERALRRTGTPLRFTEGFSPRPRMTFAPPLPVNISGTNEYFDFFSGEAIDGGMLLEKMNGFLPEGILLKRILVMPRGAPAVKAGDILAIYTIEGNGVKEEDIENFGKIIDQFDAGAKVLVKINNFSHKAMLAMLLNKKLNCISRELVKI